VLALLAFVALPVLAQAETTYTPESQEEFKVQNTTHEATKPKHTNSESSTGPNNATAHASANPPGGGKSSSQEKPEESPEKEKSSQSGGAPANEGGGKGGNGGGQGSKSANDGVGSKDGLGGSERVAEGAATPPVHKTETSSSGGSSPVVPILIAVIVLAAISIGVVLYRQRKSGGQGPDSRVSSPNAS
jgi:cobalamin biosynthesis Mg chelatase CobN